MIAGCERVDVSREVKYPATVPSDSEIDADRGVRCKVALETLVATALLLITLPVTLLAMALVKLTSPGPVIYSQVRVGFRGRPFVIYKIRTMGHDCERQTGPRWSVGKDTRVTPVGRILRRTHLDELPQLWNVIRGDMALVGPRPERPEFVAQLEKAIPKYRERLDVRPGITGLAQVQLPPDADLGSVRRKVSCDIQYIELTSLCLDARILLATGMKMAHVPMTITRHLLCLPGVEENFDMVHQSNSHSVVQQLQAS